MHLTAKDRVRLRPRQQGSGIASAIGLALGDPKRRVVCICGDGGMQMVGAEAVVALQENLPIVYAVFNDARYNMVFHGYKQMFECDAKWESPWIDFAGWGKSLGTSVRASSPGRDHAGAARSSPPSPVPCARHSDRQEQELEGGRRVEASPDVRR
jgi:thiamine pyrophosphate-dependent acetolactate synthase large subunit-like protein